jgi:hypothetical protein
MGMLRLRDDGAALSVDLRKCDGPTFDGLDYERWTELLSIWRTIELHDRVTLLNFARELARGGESARTIGLGEALAEVDRVIAGSQKKHPSSKWRTYSSKHHQGKLLRHLGSWLAGEKNDAESGCSHLAHLAARALMLAGIVIEEDKRR